MTMMMIGLVLGIFVGVLPGLGGPNGVAILLPLTFTMDPTTAIVMLSCIYWGALFGGAITSILFNIPGEAWSVATTFDGYPMAQQGKAAEALTAAFTSSFIGSLVAVLLITFLAPRIASFALKFGPPEFFAVYLLTFCSFVGLGREAKHKTLISMVVGLLLAAVGMDTGLRPVAHDLRLRSVAARRQLPRRRHRPLSESARSCSPWKSGSRCADHAAEISLRVVLKVWKEMPRYWVTLLRSSAIGCWLGITPGGAIAASFMGYNLAKRFSKDPGSFGKGRIEGVFAPETAAHASGRPRCCPCSPGNSRLRHCGDPARRAHGLGTQSRSVAVRRAQGLRVGSHRVDVSGQRRRPRAGAHHGADLCRRSARSVSPPSRR
jgi:TctA family transporter